MTALGNIDIQVLNGPGSYSMIAANMRRRAMADNRAKENVIKYHTNGLNNNTFKNIDAIVNGLDFVGFAGDGSIEDSEMLRAHIVRTKNVVDSAPQAFAGYQQPHQLSAMLGFVLDNWDTPDREAAIDNMAREERKLMAVGAIKSNIESDAHYLTDNEIYDADRQDVVKNGMVETKPGYRGLFNRIKAAGVNANVLSKDADVVTDKTLTRKAVGTLRAAVKMARKDRPKLMRKTRIKNGYVHTSILKLPQQTATTADTIKILAKTPEGKKLAENIKQPTVNGLGEIEQGTLTELLHGTDFAFNATDGLSGVDNVDNYRRYFIKMKWAIADNPKGFYDTKAEADAVIAILTELYNALGNQSALERMVEKYSQPTTTQFNGLGKLLKKVANAVKKTANKVATATTNAVKTAAKTTANATKSVAKAAVNTTKAATTAAANATKAVAKSAVDVTKKAATTAANATKSVAKAAVNTTKAATNAAANATKAVAKSAVNVTKKAATTAANATKSVAKAAANTTTAAVKSAVNATKATANVVKAGVQAATGNKDAAKQTLQKAATQAKAAVKEPVKTTAAAAKDVAKKAIAEPIKTAAKTAVQETKTLAKKAVAEPVKTVAKATAAAAKDVAKKAIAEPIKTAVKTAVQETKTLAKKAVAEPVKTVAKATAAAAKDVAKNAVAEPIKTAVKQTVSEPAKKAIDVTKKATKAALKITKKVTKAIGKVAKKVVKAILLYNPITLLIKAGLLIAFRLNMFKIASRSYAGSFNEEQFAAFAEKNGIEASNYDKFKEAYEKIHKICCGTFQMKESKVLAALEKGSKRKWSGLDAADFTEENKDQFNAQIEEAANEADNSNEFAPELDEINADTAADEAALKAQGAQASNEAPADQLTIKKNVETTEMVEQVTNGKVLKTNSPMYETADVKGKKIADLQKGETVYVDSTQASGNFIAAATVDGKQGFVDKTALAGFSTADDVAVNGIAGLVENGYEYVAGLGEAVTAAAGTAAASGWIATICAFIAKIFKGGITLIKKIVDAKQTYDDVKDAIDSMNNDNGDEIQETDISDEPLQTEQPQMQLPQMQLPQTPAPTQKKSNVGLIVGISAAVVAVGAGAYFLLKD